MSINTTVDKQLRNDFEFGILDAGSMFPDINKDPLFVKALPDVDILGKPITSDSYKPLQAETIFDASEIPVYTTIKVVNETPEDMNALNEQDKLVNDRTKNLSEKATKENVKVTTDYSQKTLLEIFHLITFNLLQIMEDLLNKPQEKEWNVYLVEIISQQDRIFSLGVLLIFISITMVFFNS